MRQIFPSLFFAFAITGICTASYDGKITASSAVNFKLSNSSGEYLRIRRYSETAKQFIAKNKLCKTYCFLIDMQVPSGKKRFFVIDLSNDSVTDSGLVTHGSGSVTSTNTLCFSNSLGSLATSAGKYKTGDEYTGKFGLAFKLYGLEAANSNAYRRAIVLHSHPFVPSAETYPADICTSWGCPTVNPAFLVLLKKYIENADSPILLWIFY